MVSDKDFVEYVADQMGNAGEISYRKMFGEYAVYCDGKVVALICDNHLFIKPTENGRAFIRDVVEASPYQGAKPYFLLEDQFEDSEWISKLVRLTADELPAPKPRKKKRGEISKGTKSTDENKGQMGKPMGLKHWSLTR